LRAIAQAAHKRKITLPPGLAIDAEVDPSLDPVTFFRARLNISLPGVEAQPPRLWSTNHTDLSVLESNTRYDEVAISLV
jgi:lipoyl-dependent peroxiredoxin